MNEAGGRFTIVVPCGVWSFCRWFPGKGGATRSFRNYTHSIVGLLLLDNSYRSMSGKAV